MQLSHRSTDKPSEHDRDNFLMLTGAALMIFGAALMLSTPQGRKLLSRMHVGDLVEAAAPNFAHYLEQGASRPS